ncbi:MAG: TIGR02206 family membrane protein [Clostridia bacterium]|nr:TIGR02206 family membrane protein [Clostridia bacterium]
MQGLTNFFVYFFGRGENVEFRNFTLAHFLPIVIMIAAIITIYVFRNKLRAYRNEKNLRLALALVMIITEMSYFWRLVGVPSLGANPQDHLPITLCGWGVIFASYMLVTGNQTLFDIPYFWLFSGTVFALITPTVITYTGPTRFRYYQFWLEHTTGYIAVFYMIFVHGMRPRIRSAVKAYAATVIMAVIAFFANAMIGGDANYLYMARPEETRSILDFLPSNYAVRVLFMAAVVTVLFFLAYLPWMIKDIKEKKKFTPAA